MRAEAWRTVAAHVRTSRSRMLRIRRFLVMMEPTIVPLKPTRFARRPGRLELDSDTLTIRHPRLRRPLPLPLSAITKVIVGPSAEVFRATTLPLAVRPGSATLVLTLDSPVKLPLHGLPGQEVGEIALAAADPTQAAIALSRLRVDAPTPPTVEQQRAARYLTFALRSSPVATALIVAIAAAPAVFGPIHLFPADAKAKARETEGRSSLAPVPVVPGAITYRATAADGARVYVWRTGDRLRVRVDSAAQLCKGFNWRQWWKTMDRSVIRIAADGRFHDRGRAVRKVAAGGVDITTSQLDGRISGDRVIASYVRRDTYNGAEGRFVCPRTEPFVARRSG
jgi:hypothetical protein